MSASLMPYKMLWLLLQWKMEKRSKYNGSNGEENRKKSSNNISESSYRNKSVATLAPILSKGTMANQKIIIIKTKSIQRSKKKKNSDNNRAHRTTMTMKKGGDAVLDAFNWSIIIMINQKKIYVAFLCDDIAKDDVW